MIRLTVCNLCDMCTNQMLHDANNQSDCTKSVDKASSKHYNNTKLQGLPEINTLKR